MVPTAAFPYSGVRASRSLWVKRPAHSATEPGYCARRTGLTGTQVWAGVSVHSALDLPPKIHKVMYAINAGHRQMSVL